MGSLGESSGFVWREEIAGRSHEDFWDSVVVVGNTVVALVNAYGGHGTRSMHIRCLNVKTGRWSRVLKLGDVRVFGGFLVRDQIYMFKRKVSNVLLKFDTVLKELSGCYHGEQIGWEHCALGVEFIEEHNIAVAISTNHDFDPVFRVLDLDTFTWSMPRSIGAIPVIDPSSLAITTRFGWQLPRKDGLFRTEYEVIATTRPLMDPSSVATTTFRNTIFIYLGERMLLLHCKSKGTFRWSTPAMFGFPKSLRHPTLTYIGGDTLALVGRWDSPGAELRLFSVRTNQWRFVYTRNGKLPFEGYGEQMAVYANNQLILCGERELTKIARLQGLNA